MAKRTSSLQGCSSDFISCKADASLSTFFTEDMDVELVCCNPIFCAPELLTSRKFDKAYDLWSLGVLLYIMLSGCDPYYPKSNGDLYRAILTGNIQFPDNLWDGISRSGRDAVKRLLVLDANQRHTTAQLLKHIWLTDDHIPGVHLAATQKRLEEFRMRRQEMVSCLLTVTGSSPSEAHVGDALISLKGHASVQGSRMNMNVRFCSHSACYPYIRHFTLICTIDNVSFTKTPFIIVSLWIML
ncbi:hypothetical protein AHF37_00960 [Paragonimus kellicotti]|nr:hypothetical protein AHF37_00960 [Paragonimus kellicotti]